MSARPLTLFFVAVIGLYVYFNVLPYRLSGMQPTTPENITGYYDMQHETGTFHGQPVESYRIPTPERLIQVLGENRGVNKHIEVDLANQRVYAFEGSTKVYDFLISSGKWGRTPTGTFTIAYKVRAQKMEGGNKTLNTYYYLPNVPYVMFFGNKDIPWSRGFSFHGTYWHDNFGHPMSHGCVNMRTADAETLYYWANPELNGKSIVKADTENPGTQVVIYGETPTS